LQLIDVLKQLDIALDISRIKACEFVLLLSLFEFFGVCFTSVFPFLTWHLLYQLQIVFNNHEVREVVE
jgi:hypothetical protein